MNTKRKMMIQITIALFLVCVRIYASEESSENEDPTWSLFSSNRTDLCSEKECKIVYGRGVSFEALWSFKGEATNPALAFNDEKDILFPNNLTYYLCPKSDKDGLWPGPYKLMRTSCDFVLEGGSYNFTTPALALHYHLPKNESKYLGDISLTFTYQDGGEDKSVAWPAKTVTVDLPEDDSSDTNDSSDNSSDRK